MKLRFFSPWIALQRGGVRYIVHMLCVSYAGVGRKGHARVCVRWYLSVAAGLGPRCL